ncbi:hypothetical protein LguiB_010215 [Lonicera macranthoides]
MVIMGCVERVVRERETRLRGRSTLSFFGEKSNLRVLLLIFLSFFLFFLNDNVYVKNLGGHF